MPTSTTWDEAVGAFGALAAAKLAGPGDKEAAIRAPLDALVSRLGELCGRPAVLHDEVRDEERRVRPDFGVAVDGIMMGYVEVKAPGRSINPGAMTGHDLQQWERQRDLPNLVYTNGTQWRLYRDGDLIADTELTGEPLTTVAGNLQSSSSFESLMRNFLGWKVANITSVSGLVGAIAPLTRLLRGEVLDQLDAERRRVAQGAREDDQPFIGLSRDWRRLLFPQADDKTFADGYAQAVTFALLLARSTGIDLEHRSLHDVGGELGNQHSLMGRALQLLTDDVAADFKVTLDLLVTLVGAVRWDRIRQSRRDVYLYLYEEFLAAYDDELRQASGTYYTPRALVIEMVRLTDEVLSNVLGIDDGFAATQVFTVDPAMGTGTFLQSVIESVRERTKAKSGAGAVPGALTELAKRLAGFEIQMGPYAVAELRVAELLAEAGASVPKDGLKLYVTDTLDDPFADLTQIASGLQTIAKSRQRANALKRDRKVNVVVGNPPYRELAAGVGGWVEKGSPQKPDESPILDSFLKNVPGKLAAKVKNLYVYFWRWATWKVWESTPADETGVVCFITTSGYLTGSAFTGMRRYLREQASEGWIIDLTPEGHTPEVPTRIFAGVRQPLAIGIFVRRAGTSEAAPAVIRYTSLTGTRAEKFDSLSKLGLDGPQWRAVRDDWTATLTAAADSDWDAWPTLASLFPWYSPGVFPTRTWVYSPSRATLAERWNRLTAESNLVERSKLMKDSTNASSKQFKHLPGHAHAERLPTIASLPHGTPPEKFIRVGYRTLDRHYLIADPRLIHRAREGLWAAAPLSGQVYVVEQHAQVIRQGPAVVFSGLLPDFDHFKGSEGGRTLPFLHPDGSPNVAVGLVESLGELLNAHVSAEDLIAYIAAVAGHPGYTAFFEAELQTPGIRIPITADPALWQQALEIGRDVVWAETYGAAFVGGTRPSADVTFSSGDPRRVQCRVAVSELPTGVVFDTEQGEIELGGGRFGPVTQAAFDFEVSGKNVLKSWVAYRSKVPAGKRTSKLDDIVPDAWEHSWTEELNELLSVLRRLTDLQPAQHDLLAAIMNGELFTVDDLADAGVNWPTTDDDRKPKYPEDDGLLAGLV